jgi:hypothetical protein
MKMSNITIFFGIIGYLIVPAIFYYITIKLAEGLYGVRIINLEKP